MRYAPQHVQAAYDSWDRGRRVHLGCQLPPGLHLEQERERQDRTYWATYTAIEQFGEHPDAASELKAKDTLEKRTPKRLGSDSRQNPSNLS